MSSSQPVAWCLVQLVAKAITNTAPAGVRAGIDTVDLVEPVHCRQYRHGHRHGHGWSRGCRIGVIVAPSAAA